MVLNKEYIISKKLSEFIKEFKLLGYKPIKSNKEFLLTNGKHIIKYIGNVSEYKSIEYNDNLIY